MDIPHVWPEQKITFMERFHEYGDVYSYVFKADSPVSYAAGQYGHVRLPGMPDGVRAVREFSFASAPNDPLIQFGIDTRSKSDYQKRLESLTEGESATLFKIKNHMTWPPPASGHAVMIAGGVGITPFRSMLLDKEKNNLSFRTTVLHINGAEFLYADDVSRIANEYLPTNRLDLTTSVLRVAEKHPQAHYYAAGSPRFIDAVTGLLAQRMISAETDSFKGLED